MAKLYGFEQQYARELQKIARNSLSGAPTGSDGNPLGNIRPPIYLVEGDIPAAVIGASNTPGTAMCKLLELIRDSADPNDGTIQYRKDRAGNEIEVSVFNSVEGGISGTLLEDPIQCHMDQWGVLWAVVGGVGLCNAITNLDVIPAEDINTITYLVGQNDLGECFRVPVANCPAQLQHA